MVVVVEAVVDMVVVLVVVVVMVVVFNNDWGRGKRTAMVLSCLIEITVQGDKHCLQCSR